MVRLSDVFAYPRFAYPTQTVFGRKIFVYKPVSFFIVHYFEYKNHVLRHIQSMLDKRTHRISEPFFISQYQFPNFLHCKTNKHRISEPRISEPHRINEPFFISQRYPNSYLSERFKKKQKNHENCRFCKEIKERRRAGSKEITLHL